MKTFEEAMQDTYITIDPATANLAEELAKQARMQENIAKFESIRQEVVDSPAFQQFRLLIVAAIGSGQLNPLQAIGTAFLTGLKAGMEMEAWEPEGKI